MAAHHLRRPRSERLRRGSKCGLGADTSACSPSGREQAWARPFNSDPYESADRRVSAAHRRELRGSTPGHLSLGGASSSALSCHSRESAGRKAVRPPRRSPERAASVSPTSSAEPAPVGLTGRRAETDSSVYTGYDRPAGAAQPGVRPSSADPRPSCATLASPDRKTPPVHAVDKIRNLAIIAHIDHGKTTLIDSIFRAAHVFRENAHVEERVMDSNDLERERGITIRSKHCTVEWKDYLINIIDTPGHADFSGEVERVLSMVDSVLLLVDANEGPMPQTRYVLMRALRLGLRPIVDRQQGRPAERRPVRRPRQDLRPLRRARRRQRPARLPGALRLRPRRLDRQRPRRVPEGRARARGAPRRRRRRSRRRCSRSSPTRA